MEKKKKKSLLKNSPPPSDLPSWRVWGLNFEVFPKIFQVTRRKVQSHFHFIAFFFSQTYLFGQSLPLSFSTTVMFEFHMQIERDIWAVEFGAISEGTAEGFFDHVRSPAHFLFGLLNPEKVPFFLSIFQLLQFRGDLFVCDWVIFDFGDHDFVEQVHFPELLVVTGLFVVLGVGWV